VDNDIVGLIFIFAVFAIPALGITARLAIKPVVEAIVRLREAFTAAPSAVSEQRFAELEAQVQSLHALLARVQEESAFERELGSAPHSAGALSSPGVPSTPQA
jgi:hypothetical protein